MFLDRKSFQYKGKSLIEKAILKPPIKHERVFHEQGCFLYFKNSKGRLNSSQEKIDIATSEAILFQCDTYFMEIIGSSSEEEVEVIAFHLYPEILKELYKNELPSTITKNVKNIESKLIVNDQILSKFVESLDFYFDNPSLVNDDLLELKIKELVLLLIQSKNVESVLELIKNLYSTRSQNFKETVSIHTFSNLTVEELAKLCNMSLSTFKREFKKTFDQSPNKYFTEKRLLKAQEMLRISDDSINDISFDIGYEDQQYFARVFKNNTGVTPTQYRAQFRK